MKKRSLILLVFCGLIITAVVVGKPYYDLHFGKLKLDEEEVVFYIHSGSNLDDVAEVLNSHNILMQSVFIDYAEKLDYNEEKIEPGKYKAADGATIKSLIYGLKNGNQEIKDARITFNYCQDIEDMAGKVAPNIEADSAEIVDFIKDPKTIEKYGFKEETIIALFLPDTYEVGEWDMTAEDFVQFMADQFNSFWSEESGRGAKLKALNLSQSEVATVASIIESEQGVFSQEWGTIAGLYLNRVRKGMKLESDPTFKFCWGDELEGVQRLLDVHREIDCPYNTYKYAGLPPGPIRMPSKKAIDAVLNAEDHDYLFMCAKPDNSGLHNFAVTYSEHLKNAKLFWRYMDSRN